MKLFNLVLATLVITGSALLWIDPPDREWALHEQLILDETSPEILSMDLETFAHDSMSGRETAMPGQRLAASHLASYYKDLGLKPVPGHSSLYQPFRIMAEQTDSLIFTLTGESGSSVGGVSTYRLDPATTSPWIPLFHNSGVLEGEIIFAGYGIQDIESGWTHLDGIDLKDRWVLLFEDLPDTLRNRLPNGTRWTSGYRFSELIQNHQALGVIVIGEETPDEYQQWMERARDVIQKPRNARLASRHPHITRNDAPKGYLKVSPELAARLLNLPEADSLNSLRHQIASEGEQFVPRRIGAHLRAEAYIETRALETENIAAWLPGSDPDVEEEAIVLTAHMDHIGTGYPDSRGDAIFNGADDNSSGTVALMAIARSLREAARSGSAPRRSTLFLHLSGEEMGLLGSRYYSDHPLYPIEKTVANLNADMVGTRSTIGEQEGGDDAIYIIGSDLVSSDLDSLLTIANEWGPNLILDRRFNDLQDPNQFYRRSDHWNFARLDIPFIFFFTGVHDRYHDPADHPETVDLDKLSKTTRLIHATLLQISNAEEPPLVDRFLPPR